MKYKGIVIIAVGALLSGCASSVLYSNAKFRYNHPPLDPPKDHRWLTIEGEIPPEVKVTMVPYYESSKGCLRNDEQQIANIYDVIYPEPGRYSLKVPLDGGTHCGWVLYKIDISSQIKDPNYYNSRIPTASQYAQMEAAAATYHLYIRPISEGEATKEVSLSARYYPYVRLNKVTEGYPASSTQSIVWFNRTDNTYSEDKRSSAFSFYYPTAPAPLGTVHFSPSVDHDYLVIASSEGSQVEDNFVNYFRYPNGDVTENEPLREYRYYEKKPVKKKPWNFTPPDD
ncbi:MAG: hypothetical protein ACRDC6_29445 [Shewanella sp.]